MADVGLGGTIELRATFRDGAGDLVDPTDPRVAVTDPGGSVRVASAVPTRESLGRYVYTYTVPVDAPTGTWTATWTGLINGVSVSGAETFTVGAAGEVDTFTRWGMTADQATTLTGVTLNASQLEAAEDELVDLLGYVPDADAYDPTRVPAAAAFGRAVAWQAAYRVSTGPGADDGAVVVKSESLGDYSVTYASPTTERPAVAPRARTLLVRWGWLNNAGTTALTRPGGVQAFQTG